jgi:predicted negative regulator of RcsB-dependent stress response
MLDASAMALPADYNPWARLARVYLEMRQFDKALTCVQRALSLVYGPRALRLYDLQADIFLAKGQKADAVASLKAGLTKVQSGSLPSNYAKLREALRSKLQSLEAP